MKERDNYFDFARAVLIFFVIFGHLSEGFWRIKPEKYIFLKQIWMVIYYFHIPAFAMISGYLSGRKGRSPNVEKLFISLILPYIFFQVLYRFYFFKSNNMPDFSVHLFSEPYAHLWYLMSLFFWRMLLPFFLNIRFAFIMTLFLGIFSILMPDASLFLSVGRTIRFFPYFFLGALLFGKGISAKDFRMNKYKIAAVIALIFFIIYYTNYKNEGDDMRVLQIFPDGDSDILSSLFQQTRIYAIGFILSGIFFIFTANLSDKFQYILSSGKYSIYPYVLHLFVVSAILNRGYATRLDGIAGEETVIIIFLILISVLIEYILTSFLIRKISKFILEPNYEKVREYGTPVFTFCVLLILLVEQSGFI